MRVRPGGKGAVAAASALLAFALAGPPLYASSATSAALQTSVAAACPSDAGILLDVAPAQVAQLDERAAAIDHAEAPVHTEIAAVRVRGTDSSAPAWLVWRDGLASSAAGSIAEPPTGQVALPGSYAADTSRRAGDRLTTTAEGASEPSGLEVAGIYPDVPVQPEPAYWCALRDVLRPDGTGDDPAPLLLASEATVREVAAESASTLWELHPDPDHLTRGAARDLVTDMRALAALAGERSGSDVAPAPVTARPDPGLAALIDQADDVGDAVTRGLIGVRLVAVAVAIGLLAVAAAAVVRSREAELRLRLRRGERPVSLALRIAERQAGPALAGTVAGAAAAYATVRALGPAPDIELSATTRAAILATIGLLIAIGTVAGVGARRADTLVDHAARPRPRFTPPWELVPLALAVVALARLDRGSGIRIVGTADPGGDALGDAFPVLAVVAAGALVVRPLRWLFGRARRGGGRLSPALLLGWRRLGADPGRYAVFAAAVVAGVAATIVASSLGLTTDRMVRDKSTTFLGSDLRVVTAGEPVIPDGRPATPISRSGARVGGSEVQVVGIDPDTFARAVHWRDDASDYPLAELLAVLEVDDMRGAPLPAIIVGGPVPSSTLVAEGGSRIDITPVATARFFPGKTAVPLVIVNRDALAADEVPAAAEIWWRDPPADATRELAAVGNLVRGSQGPADVFETGSVQAVRWSRQALWAFAVFMAAAALVGALHIAAARRHERQAARALARHIGEPAHQEFVAAWFAAAVPAAVGAACGLAVGAVTVRLLADQLDTAANLPPPARVVYDLVPAAVAAAVAIGLVIVAAITSRALLAPRSTGEVIARVQHV